MAIALNRKLNILFQVFFVFVFFRYIQIDHTVQFVSFTNKDMSTNFQELRFQHYNKNPGVQGLAACGCGEKEHLQSAEVHGPRMTGLVWFIRVYPQGPRKGTLSN